MGDCEELLKYAEQVSEYVLQLEGEDTKLIQRAINSIAKKGTFFIGHHSCKKWFCYAKRRGESRHEIDTDEGSFMFAKEDPDEDMKMVHLFGHNLSDKTGIAVDMRKVANDDFLYTISPRDGFEYFIILRLTEHMIPTKTLESGVRVVTGLWQRIWFLQYLSLPFYSDVWAEYYVAAIPIFGNAKSTPTSGSIELGGGGAPLAKAELEVPGASITGIEAVRRYGELVGEVFQTKLCTRSFCVNESFNKAYSWLVEKVGTVTFRGGIENIFQRKAFGRVNDGSVINIYDCTDHCMNKYVSGGKSYTGFYTTLLFLHYELLVWKYYVKNKELAQETFRAIGAAVRYRAKFLEENGLNGYEKECGLFRVFDVDCIGKDQEDVIKFRKSKWKNKKLDQHRHYTPRDSPRDTPKR